MGGGTSLVMALGNRQTDLHALNNFSSLIDKVSFKRNSMSLGLSLLKKLFTRLLMYKTQSDAIMSADKNHVQFLIYISSHVLHAICSK